MSFLRSPSLGAVTRPRQARLAAVSLSAVVTVGCASDGDSPMDDGVLETTHLRISNTTDNPICAGTSLLLESELERIAAALELPLWPEDDKLDIRFGVDAVTEVCAGLYGEEIDQANGCAVDFEGEPTVAAIEASYVAPHELVHAVRRHNRTWTTIPFEEGLALWPMCLEVPETTRVRIAFEADHGRLQVLGREPCDAGAAGAEAYRDKYVDADTVLEEDIAGCRYRMLLSSQEPGLPATPYTIRIEEIAG